MAKYEKTLKGDFDETLRIITEGVLSGSSTASLEESSDFVSGDARCSVRVFERYSYTGSNRVSLNLTLFQNADSDIFMSAVTSGGSQAMLFKINTLGEEAFLEQFKEIVG